MKTRLLLVAAAALCLGAPPSFARSHFYGPSATGEAPEGFLPRASAATGTLCVKQCPNDTLPCDPPSYKAADGRCTTEWH